MGKLLYSSLEHRSRQCRREQGPCRAFRPRAPGPDAIAVPCSAARRRLISSDGGIRRDKMEGAMAERRRLLVRETIRYFDLHGVAPMPAPCPSFRKQRDLRPRLDGGLRKEAAMSVWLAQTTTASSARQGPGREIEHPQLTGRSPTPSRCLPSSHPPLPSGEQQKAPIGEATRCGCKSEKTLIISNRPLAHMPKGARRRRQRESVSGNTGQTDGREWFRAIAASC